MSDAEDDPLKDHYKVGYRKPPLHSRFQPGHSLSKGRRKGSRNTKTMIVEEWHKRQPATVNGKRKHVSRSEIGARKLTTKGSEGDAKAFEIILKVEAEVAERAAAREMASRYSDPGDALAMRDIVRRLLRVSLTEATQVAPRSDTHEDRLASKEEDVPEAGETDHCRET